MRFPHAAAVAAALAALLVPAAAHASSAHSTVMPAVRQVAGETVTLPVRDALAQLPVREEDRADYERSKFRHWTDADKDGCNTRAEVLQARR